MWDGIESCRLKVVAAAGHLERLAEAVDRFFAGEHVVVGGEVNSQRTRYLLRVGELPPFPEREWGIVVGDAVHCLRSALDQLAFTFARDGAAATAFPICLKEREWVTDAPRRIWSISPAIVRFIDRVQPYHRRDPATHPLALLRALSNLDRHRTIPTVLLVTEAGEVHVSSTRGIAEWSDFRFNVSAFRPGVVVAESTIVVDDSGLEPEMELAPRLAFDIAFGRIPAAPTLRGRRVSEALEEVAEYVEQVIALFRDIWDAAVIELEGRDEEPPHAPDLSWV